MEEPWIKMQHALAANGLRRTGPRKQVLDVFLRDPLPLTAAEVHRRLRGRRVNLASVYRAIHLFCRMGILTATDQVPEGRRYELSDEHREHHHHLICQACGSIQDFEGCFLEEFERRVRHKAMFRITRHELRFFGLCHACAS